MVISQEFKESRESQQTREKFFSENGYLHVRSIFTPTEVDEIRTTFTQHVENTASKPNSAGNGNGHSSSKSNSYADGLGHDDHIPPDDILAKYPRFVHPHRRPDTQPGQLALKYMMDTRLTSIVQDVLQAGCYGAQSMFYFKPPGARGQAFHQDNMSLQASPECCIAAWIAIDPANESNGGLRIVPGSHRQSLICPGEADPGVSFSNNEIHLPPSLQDKILQTNLEAGDVLFFHGALIHGSLPNRTKDRFRRALIFHYIPQASKEVAKFYMPLIDADGKEVVIEEAPGGGACGEGWVEEP